MDGINQKECPKSQLEPILRMDRSCTGMVKDGEKEILCRQNCYAAEMMKRRQKKQARIPFLGVAD
jgi:hypothetical protein